MNKDNRLNGIRKEINTAISSLCFSGRLAEVVDKLPQKLIRKDIADPFRCCVFKDRELVRLRTIAALGFSLENEDEIDENLLSDYARKAMDRTDPADPILTFIDEACKACTRSKYVVTNICVNCAAKHCLSRCPKNAIICDGNSVRIDSGKCVSCGLCMRACHYHAIVYVPIPCEEACPTGALNRNAQGKQEIDYCKCIFCGKCLKSCPFGAIAEKSQIVDVITKIKSGNHVSAMIAPSIVGQFNGGLGQIVAALKKAGFSAVVEVALGADITVEEESRELVKRLGNGERMMGTSCCAAYIEAVHKHNPKFLPFVSDAKTPLAYTSDIARKRYPGTVTVFIGPCIAKKHEVVSGGVADYAITFEELTAILESLEIDVPACNESVPDISVASRKGKLFPVSGNVASAIAESVSNVASISVTVAKIDGFTRKNIGSLTDFVDGAPPANLIEVMSCEGGCVAGSGTIEKPQIAAKKIAQS